MKFLTITLIVLAATPAILAGYEEPGCIGFEDGRCNVCLFKDVDPNGKGCGPLKPATDPCFFYQYDFKKQEQTCAVCKFGYAQHIKRGADGELTSTCGAKKLNNCLLETDFEGIANTCYACWEEQYAVFDPKTQETRCKSIEYPADNCLWGSFALEGKKGDARCFRCAQNYAVD